MARCACQLLGAGLQERAHRLHEEAENRARQVAALAPRYIGALLRRPEPDPDRLAAASYLRGRLRAIHDHGRKYLPDTDFPVAAQIEVLALDNSLRGRR